MSFHAVARFIFIYAETLQLLGDFIPRPLTGVLPLERLTDLPQICLGPPGSCGARINPDTG